jgi:hypothetical protein
MVAHQKIYKKSNDYLKFYNLLLLLWLYSALLDLCPFFSFLIIYLVGIIPWTGDQRLAMPLPIHRMNAQIQTSMP